MELDPLSPNFWQPTKPIWSQDKLLEVDDSISQMRSDALVTGFMRQTLNQSDIVKDVKTTIQSFIILKELLIKAAEHHYIGATQIDDCGKIHAYDNIIIEKNGLLSVQGWNGNAGGTIYIECMGNLILHKGAMISVQGKGYRGSRSYSPGEGPGGGTSYSDGQYASGDKEYGDKELTQLYLGSGGGMDPDSFSALQGGNGGGIISIDVKGDIIMHRKASIMANGDVTSSMSGNGSGGSILIKCRKLNMQNSSCISAISDGRIRIDLRTDLNDLCEPEKEFKQKIYSENIKPDPFWGST